MNAVVRYVSITENRIARENPDRGRTPMHGIQICLTLFLIAIPAASPVRAEFIGPGKYQGVYHVDRWGQHRFSFLFVSPKLEEPLDEYQGVPVRMHATKVHQPINPGGGMITAVGKIEKLPSPLSVNLKWQNDNDERMIHLKQIKAGGTAKLWITYTNQTDTTFDLGSFTTSIRLFYHRPGSLSGANGFHPFSGKPARTLTISNIHKYVLPVHCEVDFSRSDRGRTTGRIGRGRYLRKGKTHRWSIRLTKVPAGEFEVDLRLWRYDRKTKQTATVASNSLYLDSLTAKAQSSQGMRVDLIPAKRAERNRAEKFSVWKVKFTNEGKKSLRFGLRRFGRDYVFFDELICYDKAGRQLLLPIPTARVSYEMHGLKPGKSLTIPVKVPVDTVTSRMVFLHRLVVQKHHLRVGEVALQHGRIVSPHVKLSGDR